MKFKDFSKAIHGSDLLAVIWIFIAIIQNNIFLWLSALVIITLRLIIIFDRIEIDKLKRKK